MNKIIKGMVLGTIISGGCFVLSEIAYKNPELKGIKLKIKKSVKQHHENQKEIINDIIHFVCKNKENQIADLELQEK